MPGEDAPARAGVDIPHAHGSVMRGGEHQSLIWTPRDASDRRGMGIQASHETAMPGECLRHAAVVEINQANRTIATTDQH